MAALRPWILQSQEEGEPLEAPQGREEGEGEHRPYQEEGEGEGEPHLVDDKRAYVTLFVSIHIQCTLRIQQLVYAHSLHYVCTQQIRLSMKTNC